MISSLRSNLRYAQSAVASAPAVQEYYIYENVLYLRIDQLELKDEKNEARQDD
jgi:hypothetical protein